MPVITLYFERLAGLLGSEVSREEIVDRIPYLGLDIEEQTREYVRVEYNPNRPDYSTDYGIARGLNGLLDLRLGAPHYQVKSDGFKISVESNVKNVRPFIVGAITRDLRLDDETIRQLIAMQEDLHMGIGRRRAKVAIGLHNLDKIVPPLNYRAVGVDFSFVPLGSNRSMQITEILQETEPGRLYGEIVRSKGSYPMITDSRGEVLSFPPIINGELTKLTSNTKNLFIDVTGTDSKTVDDALAILVAALHDAGGSIYSVMVTNQDSIKRSPDFTPTVRSFEMDFCNHLLGLDLNKKQMISNLGRARIDAKAHDGVIEASIPRYRTDILHPVDLVEEVALGYGIQNFTVTLPANVTSGASNAIQRLLDGIREALVGLSMIEVMNFNLLDDSLLYTKMNREGRSTLRVEGPKSSEHEVLRDRLLPSLLATLGRNVHEEYPQRIFEVGKVYVKEGGGRMATKENYHVAAAIAHSSANYSEIKSAMESLLGSGLLNDFTFRTAKCQPFASGRTAAVLADNITVGYVGEVSPETLANLSLKVPVGAFEIDVSTLPKK